MKKLRIVFMGTPVFALPALHRLRHAGHDVVGVYTRSPKPQGRGKKTAPSPVHAYCLDHHLEVFTPEVAGSEQFIAPLHELEPDLLVVVAYGHILSEQVLQTPRYGGVNVHGSLLPSWRGAAPIERACLAGCTMSGITIMQMTAGMDEGPIFAQQYIPVNYRQSFSATVNQFAEIGADLLVEVLTDFTERTPNPQVDELATYAPKLTKAEFQIDWHDDAARIWRLLLVSQGKAWFNYRGERLLVKDARVINCRGTAGQLYQAPCTIGCGRGALELLTVQRPGRVPQTAASLFSGDPHFSET